MSQLDWIILVTTLLTIIAYGLYKSRVSHNLDGYFLSNRSMPWGLVLLSIMGTQASAITFLAAPGQAYTEGMGFVQYYFGLPLAMVVICIFFVPIFSRLKVYTAYEYLETRFDGKTRTLTSFLFLTDRESTSGKMLNEYLMNKDFKLSDEAVHLLFSVNRWEQKEEIIKDLEQGTTLICDRYAYSGVVYSAAKVLINI